MGGLFWNRLKEQMHCENLDSILVKKPTNQQTALKDILGKIGKLNMHWMVGDIIGIIVGFLRCDGRIMFMQESVFIFRSGILKDRKSVV